MVEINLRPCQRSLCRPLSTRTEETVKRLLLPLLVVTVVLCLSAPALARSDGDTFSFDFQTKSPCGSLHLTLDCGRKQSVSYLDYRLDSSTELGAIVKQVTFNNTSQGGMLGVRGALITNLGGAKYELGAYWAPGKKPVTIFNFSLRCR